MKYKLKISDIWLVLSFFLITIGHCTVLSNNSTLFIYSGIFILMITTIQKYRKRKERKSSLKLMLIVFVLSLMMSLGVILGDSILIGKKIELIISFMLPVYFTVFGVYAFDSINRLKHAITGIVLAALFSVMISLVSSVPIIQRAGEGLSFGLNAGLGHKNAFAIMMLPVATYYLWEYKLLSKKEALFPTILFSIAVILSSSRTSWVLLFVTFVIVYFDAIKKIRKSQRILLIVSALIVAFLIGAWFVNTFVLTSANYGVRLLGVNSFINALSREPKTIFLGIPNTLYAAGTSYHTAFWTFLGGQGSTEIGLLNIIAKNGALGLLAYLVIFISAFKQNRESTSINYKLMSYSLVIPMILSMFVEVYLTQIIYPYTVFAFCALSCIIVNRKSIEPSVTGFY